MFTIKATESELHETFCTLPFFCKLKLFYKIKFILKLRAAVSFWNSLWIKGSR